MKESIKARRHACIMFVCLVLQFLLIQLLRGV